MLLTSPIRPFYPISQPLQTLQQNPGAIPDKYLDAGMTPQPDCQSRGLSVGQQVDDAVAFQIAQDRAVALAFAPSPVVDAENTDFRHWIGNRLADAAQQRRGADRDCHPARQARSGIAAQCQGHGMVQGAKTIGVASPGPGYGIGTFGEGPLAADGVYTAEAADAHQKNKPLPQARNVAEAAPVVAVNPRRPNTAGRTGSILLIHLYSECKTRALRIDPIDDVETWEEL
ncbi:hypothetical protein N826_08820 [Skermanella aerolata KACC 11604]|nr:hypothetical protein N826_08820 [Skermanella aerolata KACC 11604]